MNDSLKWWMFLFVGFLLESTIAGVVEMHHLGEASVDSVFYPIFTIMKDLFSLNIMSATWFGLTHFSSIAVGIFNALAWNYAVLNTDFGLWVKIFLWAFVTTPLSLGVVWWFRGLILGGSS